MKKERPICPQCGKKTIVIYTPPRKGIVGTWFGYATLGTSRYIDWSKAHLYCCNGQSNCNYEVPIMNDPLKRLST